MSKSSHNLSNYKLLSCDQGQLVPVSCRAVLPGDVWRQSTSLLIRTNPLVTPVMHPVRARVHHFFVPNRIIWDEFEPFITGGPIGTSTPAHPVIACPPSTGFAVKSLADYLGVTPGVPDRQVNALPFRAYAKIYNEFYRDQDLVPEVALSTASGTDSTTNVALQFAMWERDRFTLSRLLPQKGPAVTMPLGTSAPVRSNAAVGTEYVTALDDTDVARRLVTDTNGVYLRAGAAGGTDERLFTDLSLATPPTITELRTAFALQQYAENRSLYGSRYTDYLAFLGVDAQDMRLQRPEYLGGGVQTIQFSEVVQTSPAEVDTDETPLGRLGGHGIGAMKSNRFHYRVMEHGFIITLVSVLPKTIYAQGLEREWNKRTKEDYWQRELEHVGQFEVQNQEVYMAHSDPTGRFGFIDRYDEYRRAESSVAGEFRTVLDDWHMARIFSTDVALNDTFVRANPTDRIYADTSTNELQIMARHSIKALRLVSKNGTPRSF